MHPRPGHSRGLSSTTVHGIHTTLHHALRAAVEQGLIPINPADEVEPPKVVRQPILGHTKASFTLDTYTHTTGDMQKRAADIVGSFLTDYLGEEMKPWQSAENAATAE